MKPHLLVDNSEFPQLAQPLIPLVLLDAKAGTLVVDLDIAESLLGLPVNGLLKKYSPQNILTNAENTNSVTPAKKYSDSLAEETAKREEKHTSASIKNFHDEGRKAARLLRRKKAEGYKSYEAQQEVARILDKPWTQIQYSVQDHNRKLKERYERLRDRMIFRLWAEEGMAIKEIAKRLNKHPKTISVWIKNIQSKKGNI